MSNARVNRMFMEEPAAESETTTEEDMFGKPILLGKGTTIDDRIGIPIRIVHNCVEYKFKKSFSGDRKSVKFEWVITEWSKCSPPCGGNGYQVGIIYSSPRLDFRFLYKHVLYMFNFLTDESRSLYGQAEQHDAERGQ